MKPGDKSRLEAARKELEDVLEEYGGHLTDAEKESVQSKIDAIDELLSQLDKITAPETGDSSYLWLWLALMLVSCGGVIATTLAGKKTREIQ